MNEHMYEELENYSNTDGDEVVDSTYIPGGEYDDYVVPGVENFDEGDQYGYTIDDDGIFVPTEGGDYIEEADDEYIAPDIAGTLQLEEEDRLIPIHEEEVEEAHRRGYAVAYEPRMGGYVAYDPRLGAQPGSQEDLKNIVKGMNPAQAKKFMARNAERFKGNKNLLEGADQFKQEVSRQNPIHVNPKGVASASPKGKVPRGMNTRDKAGRAMHAPVSAVKKGAEWAGQHKVPLGVAGAGLAAAGAGLAAHHIHKKRKEARQGGWYDLGNGYAGRLGAGGEIIETAPIGIPEVNSIFEQQEVSAHNAAEYAVNQVLGRDARTFR